jgi:hypothetical protein
MAVSNEVNLLYSKRLEFVRGESSVKREEGVISLKPCAFYRGHPYMKKGSGQCKFEDSRAGCGGDFKFCEHLETFMKYVHETGLGWQRQNRIE